MARIRSPVLVPISSSYSLDLHGWNLEEYPKAEGEFSTGNIWSRLDQPPRKKYRDLKDRVGHAVSLYLSALCKHFSIFAINGTSFTSVDFKRLHQLTDFTMHTFSYPVQEVIPCSF